MLRLVICAPTRAPEPECRLDLHYHRVLSFRAFVNDVQISSWRGLTGSYPSRLFVLPLNQVIDEYNQVELRDLISIPLRLGADEIAALLERAGFADGSVLNNPTDAIRQGYRFESASFCGGGRYGRDAHRFRGNCASSFGA